MLQLNRSARKSKPNRESQKQAVLYARVSSKEQEREGFSIQAQQKLLREYADKNGIAIAKEFVDVETAKTTGRPQFNHMLQFMKKSPTSRIVLVEKTDRLYRNLKDWVTLDELGAEIHLVKENAIISDDARASEKFVHGIKVLMAKQYIDNLSEETKKGMLTKAEDGIYPSRAPVGYRNVMGPAGKKIIEPDPEKAPLVEYLFREYSGGRLSLDALTKQAKDAGFTGPKRPFSKSQIHYILKNPIYMGDFEWNGRIYRGNHTPLVVKGRA